jgi:hypothetical protein
MQRAFGIARFLHDSHFSFLVPLAFLICYQFFVLHTIPMARTTCVRYHFCALAFSATEFFFMRCDGIHFLTKRLYNILHLTDGFHESGMLFLHWVGLPKSSDLLMDIPYSLGLALHLAGSI